MTANIYMMRYIPTFYVLRINFRGRIFSAVYHPQDTRLRPRDPRKNLTAKVNPKYVKCWGV